MRESFASRLRCPRCHAQRPFSLTADENGPREVRVGTLTCAGCGHMAGIREGIVDLLHDPPDFVTREAAGLERFAQLMRDDGWTRERVVALPEGGDGYWYAQAVLMDQTLRTMDFGSGETILDLGSNTCWASAEFARKGLDVTALDIASHEMQGLRTAEWQFSAKDVFFERVLGVMFDLPFADGSFDYVWACEVLHHNHRKNLLRTLRECFRVLRPGGRLIVANEPLRSLREPKLDPGQAVAEFEGHEHAYLRLSYTTLARQAGFEVDVRGPWYHPIFRPHGIAISEQMNDAEIVGTAAKAIVRRRPWLRAAVLGIRAYVVGGTALHMICTKPREA